MSQIETGARLGRTCHVFVETYNPWTVVNLVFAHLAEEGLHPVLGQTGNPGMPAADLLRALGITPAPEGNAHVSAEISAQLAHMRESVLGDG